MLNFDALYGNAELKKSLRHSLSVRFPQAVLLTGTFGTGKLTLAKILSAALLCNGDSAPCGTCSVCRRIEQNIHPDVTIIDAEDGEIKIDTARMIRSECAVFPSESKRRVFLIRHAQNCNAAAQNALLKILEEPPEYVFFILMTENSGGMLPTILSRCTQFSLSPLSVCELTSLLRARYPDKSQAVIKDTALACQGIAGTALDMLSGDAGQAAEYAAPFLKALASADELELFEASLTCASLNRRQFSQVLSAISVCLRDAVFISEGLSGVLFPALAEQSRILSSKCTSRQLLALYDWVQVLLMRVQRNQSMALLTSCLAARSYELIHYSKM